MTRTRSIRMMTLNRMSRSAWKCGLYHSSLPAILHEFHGIAIDERTCAFRCGVSTSRGATIQPMRQRPEIQEMPRRSGPAALIRDTGAA